MNQTIYENVSISLELDNWDDILEPDVIAVALDKLLLLSTSTLEDIEFIIVKKH